MRIVWLTHRYAPSIGGVEKYVHEMAQALTHLGHEVRIVTGAISQNVPESETRDGIPILRFPALRSPLRARWWFLRHASLFRRADVVHVSNTHMLEYLWRMLGPALDVRKVFLTRHGMSYVHPVPLQERRRAMRSMSLAAGVIHDGRFIEKQMGVKPDICPDQGLYPPADELEAIPESGPDRAVFVGRLEPDSGIALYLDALDVLRRRHGLPMRLDVYGDGSLADELKERTLREGLSVAFHGAVPDAQRFITDGCFAFLDGRMAIQEAMARRRLVIAAYGNPLKHDYVCAESFSPYLVAGGGGADLAENIAYYVHHPQERAQRVAAAFQHAKTLTWKRTAEAYLRLWQARLKQPRLLPSRTKRASMITELNIEPFFPKTSWARRIALPTRAGKPASDVDFQQAGATW